MNDLLGLLVCFTNDIFAHALCIDQCALEHFAVRFKALQLLVKLLVLGSQIGDLFPKLLHLCIIAVELFLDLVQKTVHVLCAVAAEVLLELHRTYILRSQHSNFLPLFNIEKTR